MNTRAVLALCRIPNVFTSVANVAAGALIARGRFEERDLLLLAASACLYLAGMVLNDYFDRETDAIERPDRPIPSGQVSARAALLLGLGLAATGTAPPAAWMWIAPLTMGAYTAAITSLSQDEVGGSTTARARRGVSLVATALLGALVALALVSPASRLAGFLWLAPFAAFVAWRACGVFGPVLTRPTAPTIGRAIGGGILLMPAIDAAMVAASGLPAAALVVLALTVPAWLLKRRFAMT